MNRIGGVPVIVLIAMLLFSCASKQPQPAHTLATLVCETSQQPGQTTKKVCREIGEQIQPKAGQELLTIYCKTDIVDGQPKNTCVRIDGLVCAKRIETGSHIVTRYCEKTTDREKRGKSDQRVLSRWLRQAR